jgi:hypothetical protein
MRLIIFSVILLPVFLFTAYALAVDSDELLKRIEELEQRVAALEEKLAAAPQQNVVGDVVAVFEGEGIMNTTPFTVDGPWVVEWTVQNENGFTAFISTQRGDLAGVIHGAASGSSFYPGAGTYFFMVNVPGGKWKIVVKKYKGNGIEGVGEGW